MNGNLEKLCRRITDCADNQMGIWQWGQGVALYSLSQVAKKQKAEFCMDYIKTWIDGKLSEAYPGKSINTTAPCLSALERYKLSGETKYIKLCEDFADWCMAQAPRSERGACGEVLGLHSGSGPQCGRADTDGKRRRRALAA